MNIVKRLLTLTSRTDELEMERLKIKRKWWFILCTTVIFIFILSVCMPSKSSVSERAQNTPAILFESIVSTELRFNSVSAISESKEELNSHVLTGSHHIKGIGLQLISGDNGTTWMNGITVEGKINCSRNYAVFSATTENSNAQDYMFYLPLTTLAWKRIGFSSIILVAGSSNKSFSDPLLRYVISKCLEHDAIVMHIFSPLANTITISQVGRLFTANILRAAFADIDLVYLITSDADLWPINSEIYRLRSDMAVLSLNSDCCAPFSHRGLKYKMLPMSNIGMRVMTWNKLTERDSILPTSSQDILNVLYREFGPVALQPVSKGENKGWYLDQLMISIMMKNWTDQYGSSHVMFVPRKTANDRIDRSHWNGDSSLDGKIDAHMPLKAFTRNIWKGIIPLLKSLYVYNSERYNWSIKYFDEYRKYNPK